MTSGLDSQWVKSRPIVSSLTRVFHKSIKHSVVDRAVLERRSWWQNYMGQFKWRCREYKMRNYRTNCFNWRLGYYSGITGRESVAVFNGAVGFVKALTPKLSKYQLDGSGMGQELRTLQLHGPRYIWKYSKICIQCYRPRCKSLWSDADAAIPGFHVEAANLSRISCKSKGINTIINWLSGYSWSEGRPPSWSIFGKLDTLFCFEPENRSSPWKVLLSE